MRSSVCQVEAVLDQLDQQDDLVGISDFHGLRAFSDWSANDGGLSAAGQTMARALGQHITMYTMNADFGNEPQISNFLLFCAPTAAGEQSASYLADTLGVAAETNELLVEVLPGDAGGESPADSVRRVQQLVRFATSSHDSSDVVVLVCPPELCRLLPRSLLSSPCNMRVQQTACSAFQIGVDIEVLWLNRLEHRMLGASTEVTPDASVQRKRRSRL